MSYEDCVNDTEKASENFVNFINAQFQRSGMAASELLQMVHVKIADLNRRIRNGPLECQNYQLKSNAVDRLADIYLSCGPTLLDPQFVDNGKLINELLPKLKENKSENKEKLCEELMPAMNGYCDRVKTNADLAINCDAEEKFNEIYIEAWLKCINIK
ncbi:PREDICTED: uncharacterized protein LOC108563334 isoform X2 [Nicrophorus vespilloides]|nr:PREDICTED: uncharacterized protein LOC108563334 isoform X2 [Nicrophorus vespilloides]